MIQNLRSYGLLDHVNMLNMLSYDNAYIIWSYGISIISR